MRKLVVGTFVTLDGARHGEIEVGQENVIFDSDAEHT